MNAEPRPSLFGRALLALLLTIGFYTLALGLAFGLLYLVYLEVAVLGRVNVRLTIFALIGAGVIIWSILPRIDRFTAPGPRLTRQKFPALFKEIERIAKLTGQEMPRDVYLVPDVNAFVAERGGFMGVGTRRVMGIGLPLFSLLSVDELNAVLAHEFGHFYGGDTALGPWVYKTRAAIIRTVVNVGQTNQWLMIPFEAYAKMFLRVSNAVSRQQEFSADQLAARTVGAQAAIGGLQKVHKYGYAFSAFFNQEYLPVVNAGYQPPMLKGFELFLKAPKVTEAVNKYYDEQLTQGKTDPYDTHPALKERIAALETLPAGPTVNDYPAATLLPDTENLEDSIVRFMLEQVKQTDRPDRPRAIAWENVVETAFVPQWEKSIQPYKTILNFISPLSLFDEAQNPRNLFEKIAAAGNILPPNVKPMQVPQDVQARIINNVIGSALAFTLNQNGWTVRTAPGEDLVFLKGGKELRPFNFFPHLASQGSTRDQWRTFCEENGIHDIRLVS